MKKNPYILLVVIPLMALVSCREDNNFTSSIFDTETPVVDTTLATAEFDQWIYDNFTVPYNVTVHYRHVMQETDLDYQLTPADYEKSQVLAHLLQYLFYQPYAELVGDEFLKANSPRQFQFIGSYGSERGAYKLGYASAGIAIALMDVNQLNMDLGNWTKDDIEMANLLFFHTIHHEFSHILHQHKLIPSQFRVITDKSYDPNNWTDRSDVEAHQLGYMTPYGSSAYMEDFVEIISGAITDTEEKWMTRIVNATLPGIRSGNREEIFALMDSLRITGIDDADKSWNNFDVYRWEDTHGNIERYLTSDYVNMLYRYHDPNYVEMKKVGKDYLYTNGADSIYFRLDVRVNPVDGDYSGFRDYLANCVKYSNSEELAGINSLLRKIDIVTSWYTNNWGLHLYQVRANVQARQNRINEYLTDSVAPYILHLP